MACMQTRIRGLTVSLLAALLVVPFPARADVGIPMIFVTMPAMLLALVPVIAVEIAIMARSLRLTVTELAGPVTIANLASTLIGIPVTWFLLVILQMSTGGGSAYGIATFQQKLLAVTWQAPWLIPYEPELRWMIPAAALFLLVPFFLVSWWIEGIILRRSLAKESGATIGRSSFLANLCSYILLGGVAVDWLIRSLR